ncbi:hypothetical protein [Lactococcus lactis]
MNQKEIKALKKEIIEEGALNVGYYPRIISKITELWPEMIAEFVKEIALQGLDVATISHPLILNLFVTKAIEKMNYQEFKILAPYFLGYRQAEDEILAEPIQITRREYLRFQFEGEKLFDYKEPNPSLEERLKALTTMVVSNDNQPIAYQPISHRIAILESCEEMPEPFIDPGLINDINERRPYPELVAIRLLESSSHLRKHYLEAFKQLSSEELSEDELLAFVSSRLASTDDALNPQEVLNINETLANEKAGMELITHRVTGYCQKEQWELAYLKVEDVPEEKSNIIYYLEHDIGAYYRGSLAWLDIYDVNQEVEERYIVDREALWSDPLSVVQALTGDPTYLSMAMYEEVKGLDLSEDRFNQFILMSNEERRKFLQKENKEKTQTLNPSTKQRR